MVSSKIVVHVVAVLGVALSTVTAHDALGQNPDTASSDARRLDVSFLFHFNQDLAPLGPAAAEVAYVGLLETLRAHSEMPFQIQISGTLINNLTWFDNRPLELIREGVAEKQFELWGSTYSQNVMYASADVWTNEQQIRTHRRLLHEWFGVEPEGFWNPERVWTQDFVPLLTRNGYRFTTVEQHILESSPGYVQGHHLRSTRANGDTLTIINDDTEFLRMFDAAVASGSSDSLLLYLRGIYEADTLDRALVSYFQDAEAMGLWQVERGDDPHVVWRNLSDLLTVLAKQTWIHITTGGRFIADHSATDELTPISDGQADWMITFSRGMGYDDWYDYFARDPVQVHFRPLFVEVRDSLRQVRAELEEVTETEMNSEIGMGAERGTNAEIGVNAEPEGRRGGSAAASKLFQRAVRTFLAHEYEYGASWYWTNEYGDFNLVRETLVSLLAVRYALHPAERVYLSDVNRDGTDEVVLVDSTNLCVFTPSGGRLLYWFDLEGGESLVGNENYSYYTERYVNGSHYVPALKGGTDVYPWLRAEDGWLLRREDSSEIFAWTFEIRRTALGDWLYDDGVSVDSLVHRRYDVQLEDDRVHFAHQSKGIHIGKTVSIDGRNGLLVDYSIRNDSAAVSSVEFIIENAFSPSYMKVMDHGASSLEYVGVSTSRSDNPPPNPGVRNTITGSGVSYEFDDPPLALLHKQVVFGLELNPVYQLNLPPGSERRISFSLVGK